MARERNELGEGTEHDASVPGLKDEVKDRRVVTLDRNIEHCPRARRRQDGG